MMGSIHNDLHSWAASARVRGHKTIEISIEVAEKASEIIVSQANEIADLREGNGKHKEDLGRFGHHPDPAIDFCVEVETIESEHFNTKIGFTSGTPTADELRKRVDRAMSFRVGGDLNAIAAKQLLRAIEEEIWQTTDF